MNITFVNRMMGIKIGGGESFDLNLARALKKRGHRIEFVVGVAEDKEIFLEKEFKTVKIKTPYLRNLHYKFPPTNPLFKFISVSASMIDGTWFENKAFGYLKNGKSDIYQLCGLSELGERLEKAGRVSSIFWPGPPSFRRANSIRACSLHFAQGDTLKRLKMMVDEVYEINPGIDKEIFYPPENRKDREKVKFVFVGRLVPVKNIPFLIRSFKRALKEFKKMELLIVGEGESEKELKNISGDNENIKFLGFKNEKELSRIYRDSDVFCIVSDYESFSIVTLEAMASSLPVIASNSGYLPNLVRGCGVIVESGDEEGLKSALLKLAKDRDLRERLGRAGYEKVSKNFDWDESAKKVEKLYEEVLGL